MKKEYVAPKTMLVEMGDNLMQDIIIGGGSGEGGGHNMGANSMSFMDFGGSTGGSPIAFN
jgi:hypothetical protein